LTLAAASVLGDVDPGTLSRIENGLVKPHPLTVVKLAQGLGIDARRMREILTTPPSEDELELEDAQ
jgi:transcriptional regulator with XRE-family HTH domain